jgi:hypothetical protein
MDYYNNKIDINTNTIGFNSNINNIINLGTTVINDEEISNPRRKTKTWVPMKQ